MHQHVDALEQPDRLSVFGDFSRAPKLGNTAGQSGRRTFPNLIRTHVAEDRCEGCDPGAAADRDVVSNGRPHPDLATAFEMYWAHRQILPGPPSSLYIGTRLYGNVVINSDEVQW